MVIVKTFACYQFLKFLLSDDKRNAKVQLRSIAKVLLYLKASLIELFDHSKCSKYALVNYNKSLWDVNCKCHIQYQL